MALGAHVVLGFGHFAIFINDDRRADEAFRYLAVVVLLAPCAIGFSNLVVFIGQDREVQFFFFGELVEFIDRVRGDPDDGVPVGGEALNTRPKSPGRKNVSKMYGSCIMTV